MGFNSAFKGLIQNLSYSIQICVITLIFKQIKNQWNTEYTDVWRFFELIMPVWPSLCYSAAYLRCISCLLIQIKNQHEKNGKYEALEDTLTLSNEKSKKGSSTTQHHTIWIPLFYNKHNNILIFLSWLHSLNFTTELSDNHRVTVTLSIWKRRLIKHTKGNVMISTPSKWYIQSSTC